MKKTFIIFAALFLSVTGIAAQNNDIERFWNELKALEGNEVECEAYDAGSYVKEQFFSQLAKANHCNPELMLALHRQFIGAVCFPEIPGCGFLWTE